MSHLTPLAQTPDLTSYRAVHTAIRRAPHRMAAAVLTYDPADARRIDAFAQYWKGYAAEVLAHHTVEDEIMFPALVNLVGAARRLIDRTDEEHHVLDHLMERCAASIAAFRHDAGREMRHRVAADLIALADHMDAHLDFEDAEILPLFESRMTWAEFDALEQRVKQSIKPGPQAAFAVPFIVDAVDGETRVRLFENAPRALKLLYRVTHRRHARLTARVLGGAAVGAASSFEAVA